MAERAGPQCGSSSSAPQQIIRSTEAARVRARVHVAPEVRVRGAKGARRGAEVTACRLSCARADAPGSEVAQ
eukprot:2606587-Pyramimonas_sp.AAC.2